MSLRKVWRHPAKTQTLAQLLEDARITLHVHGYLRDSESRRIRDRLAKDWERESTGEARVSEQGIVGKSEVVGKPAPKSVTAVSPGRTDPNREKGQ